MRLYTPIDFVLKAGKPVYKFFNEEELKRKNYYNQKTLEHCMAISVPAAPGVYEIPSGCPAGTKKFVAVQQTNQPPVTTSMQFFENCAPSSVPSSDVNNETNDEEKPNDEVPKGQGCAVAGNREKAQTAADFETLRQLMKSDLGSFICETIAKLQSGKGDILMHDGIGTEVTIQDCDKPLTAEGNKLIAALRDLDDYLKAALKVDLFPGLRIDLFPGLNSIFQDSDNADADIETKIAANEDLKSSHGIDMQGEWAPSASDALLSTLEEGSDERRGLMLALTVGAARGLKARKQKVEAAAQYALLARSHPDLTAQELAWVQQGGAVVKLGPGVTNDDLDRLLACPFIKQPEGGFKIHQLGTNNSDDDDQRNGLIPTKSASNANGGFSYRVVKKGKKERDSRGNEYLVGGDGEFIGYIAETYN